jgi:hypothetical protein
MTLQPLLLEMPKFIPPTMEQVREQAEKMSLPEIQARQFWLFYESKGWKVGKEPMKKWRCALAGWQLRWQDRAESASAKPVSQVDKVAFGKEYERILARLKVLDNSYDSHQDMRPLDRIEKGKLIQRRNELRKILGVTI